MSKLRFKISLSLDGFVAGPHQSVDNPLGIGGMQLHEWAFPLAVVAIGAWSRRAAKSTRARGSSRSRSPTW